MLNNQKKSVSIKLESHDRSVIEEITKNLHDALFKIPGMGSDSTNIRIQSIFLPKKKSRITVLLSPHVYSKSKEHYAIVTYSVRLDIYTRGNIDMASIVGQIKSMKAIPGFSIKHFQLFQ